MCHEVKIANMKTGKICQCCKLTLVLDSLDLFVNHVIPTLYQHPCLSFSHPIHPSFLPGELQYSPAVLQQRMAAELQYLESIEESVRQLGDVERLMGVSMAQQESASLAQMLKVKEFVAESNKKE